MDNNKIQNEKQESTLKSLLSFVFVLCIIIPLIVLANRLLGFWVACF